MEPEIKKMKNIKVKLTGLGPFGVLRSADADCSVSLTLLLLFFEVFLVLLVLLFLRFRLSGMSNGQDAITVSILTVSPPPAILDRSAPFSTTSGSGDSGSIKMSLFWSSDGAWTFANFIFSNVEKVGIWRFSVSEEQSDVGGVGRGGIWTT